MSDNRGTIENILGRVSTQTQELLKNFEQPEKPKPRTDKVDIRVEDILPRF